MAQRIWAYQRRLGIPHVRLSRIDSSAKSYGTELIDFDSDKRPYEFIGRNSGQRAVERRVPDATMGLKSYNDTEVGKEFPCSKSGCNDDHTHQNPHKSLSAKRIKHQLYLRESGLIVDGVWGKTDLLFPFAVYEAKKKTTTYQQAKNQIYHACQTYLAMIDDLARDPTDLSKYQSKESEHHQMFAFISCGSYWEVYTAWYFLGSCVRPTFQQLLEPSLSWPQFVETIWEADIKNFSRAYDLICIVDQIHDFAVTRHRPFVTRHLEAWLTRAENIETHQITEQPVLEEQPEWANIKQASKLARKAKAAQTRNHNFLLKSQMGTRKMFAQDSTPESIIQQVNAVQESDDNPGQVERGRRRRSKPDTNTRATRSSRVLRKRKLKA